MPSLLFVTGTLAADWLAQTLDGVRRNLRADFGYGVAALDIEVAAFMTTRFVAGHLRLDCAAPRPDLIVLPGFCKGDVALVTEATGVAAVRGPSDLKDLPGFIADAIAQPDGTPAATPPTAPRPNLTARLRVALAEPPTPDVVAQVVECARRLVAAGVDAIAPEVAGSGAAAVCAALNDAGVFLARPEGCTLPLPPLAAQGTLALLAQAAEMARTGGAVTLDLDPMLDSIRADTGGAIVLALSLAREAGAAGIICAAGDEWDIGGAVTGGGWRRGRVREVVAALDTLYPHTRRTPAVQQAEPGPPLSIARDTPFSPVTAAEVALVRAAVSDSNFRILTDGETIYMFNRDVFWAESDCRRLLRRLVAHTPPLTPSHALYLGRELYKADLARRLNKRYRQDAEFDWGIYSAESACT